LGFRKPKWKEHLDSCLKNIKSAGLPLSASKSMNYISSCLAHPNSWVAKHYQRFNIQDPVCHWGYDEVCSLNLAVSSQPSCPHQLGATNVRLPDTVYIQYRTGARIPAP
jgi:hypothetical protein